MIERFERRIEEIEAQIKPQLDEARALKAGLSRLRQDAKNQTAASADNPTNGARGKQPRRPMRPTASPRHRR